MRCQPFRVNERLYQRINGALTARSVPPLDRGQVNRLVEEWWTEERLWGAALDPVEDVRYLAARSYIFGFLDAIPEDEVGYVGG